RHARTSNAQAFEEGARRFAIGAQGDWPRSVPTTSPCFARCRTADLRNPGCGSAFADREGTQGGDPQTWAQFLRKARRDADFGTGKFHGGIRGVANTGGPNVGASGLNS